MLDFESIIRFQAQRYHRLAPQDVCKAIYQATLGPGHLITDDPAAIDALRAEAATAQPHTSEALFEPLGGRFLRLHLGGLNCSGLAVETLAKLFMLSGRMESGTQLELEAGVAAMIKLADEGALGFDGDAARSYADWWRREGFPAVHHSEEFRQKYAPAYRVLAQQAMAILPLLSRIDGRLREGRRVVVAIDGMCGSGKSFFAALLHQIYGCTVFHADDYFLRAEQRTKERLRIPGANLDRERLLEEILIPLRFGAEEITYRRFDCSTMELGEPQTVKVGQLVIVEGSYSIHPDLMRYYTDSVFIHIGTEGQRERILRRNGEDGAQEFFDRWIPMENEYIVGTQANRRCEFLLESKDIEMTFKPEWKL